MNAFQTTTRSPTRLLLANFLLGILFVRTSHLLLPSTHTHPGFISYFSRRFESSARSFWSLSPSLIWRRSSFFPSRRRWATLANVPAVSNKSYPSESAPSGVEGCWGNSVPKPARHPICILFWLVGEKKGKVFGFFFVRSAIAYLHKIFGTIVGVGVGFLSEICWIDFFLRVVFFLLIRFLCS